MFLKCTVLPCNKSGYNRRNSQSEVGVKRRHLYGAVAIGWVSLFFLVSSGWAQEAAKQFRIGIPQDWSQHHIVFTRDALQRQPELLAKELRIVHQGMQRWGGVRPNFNGAGSAPTTDPQRDWNVTMGGRLAANMFPAKYSFDPAATPDCTNDYAVFGLNVAGINGGRANMVGFNNLYVGTIPVVGLCGSGPQPLTMFAYNITTVAAGRIATSPVLSADGTKIAFVETGSTSAVFHVLTWSTGAGNGTITVSAVPGTGNAASMTSLTYATTAPNTRSSPWVDYVTDTAYVGADDGKIYKITGVFKGTPTLAGAPWPVTVSANIRLTPPVVDNRLGLVMVGSQNGVFSSINIGTGVVKSLVVGRSGGTNPGILAAPIVDVTNGTSFVVSSNDGASGVFVEVDSATMTQMTKGVIGIASRSGTAINLYEPAFSNDYFNDPSTGVARLCGTGAADMTPRQYAFGFTGRTMNAAPVSSSQLLTSTAARCTGWTEFFNPNVGAPPGTDFFFFGLTADCTGAGTSGCVVSNANGTSITTADVTGGPSGIVVDNFSTDGQASSIYLTGFRAPNLALKFTQSGLQ
jgi:hypothetical protein